MSTVPSALAKYQNFRNDPIRKHPFKVIFLTLLLLSFSGPARADLYFEQKCHIERKGMSGAGISDGALDFERRTFITGELLVFQVVIEGQVRREYGFDFGKSLYYEADPAENRYKTFDLGRVAEEYDYIGVKDAPRAGRDGITKLLSEAILEGVPDYPIRSRASFFGKKKLHGFSARHISVSMGPGSMVLNFLGWTRRAGVWATREIPGYPEYRKAVENLREKALFYKSKYNLVSDFVTLLLAVDDFPLEVRSTAKRRFAQAPAVETARETLSFISTKPIDLNQLVYVKKGEQFSPHVLFEEGSSIQRRRPLPPQSFGEASKKTLPWAVVPVFFFIVSFLWYSSISGEDVRYSLRRRVLGRLYAVLAFLFVWQWAHLFLEIPFLGSIALEFLILFLAGSVWVGYDARAFTRRLKETMDAANLHFCPRCRKVIEKFYLSCPECHREI